MARKQIAEKKSPVSPRRPAAGHRKVDGSKAAAPRRRKPAASTAAPTAETSHEDIARLAYALWESRGGAGGSPEEDWFQAERILAAHLR